jgi:hypothetical protein
MTQHATGSVSARYVSEQMRQRVGRELDRRVSYPIASSDIPRWAVAVYYPQLPPRRFWAAPDGPPDSGRLAAPEDFNPFAWLVADPPGLPPTLRDPEEVLGIPGPEVTVRLRGGMTAEYGVPMRAGDVITSVRRLAGYDEREGAAGRCSSPPSRTPGPTSGARSSRTSSSRSSVTRTRLSPTMADPRSGTGSLGQDALRVGAEIPTFVRTTGPANWSRYADVNDEFVGIHMDDEAGRAAGAPGARRSAVPRWAC